MTPRQLLAYGLADTFLAGEADLATLTAAAQQATGQKWRWIPGLCRTLLKQTGEHFHAYSRQELAALIGGYHGLDRAWSGPGDKPAIRRYCISPAILPPAPEWLAPLGLPQLPTPGDLAQWLTLDVGDLDWFADRHRTNEVTDDRLRHYHYRWVEKRSGGKRLIEIPKERLRSLQRHILHKLLAHVPPHEAAHGFRKGRSALTHARLHVGQAVVIRMDLQDFFSSIAASRVQALFTKLDYPAGVAGAMTRLCTTRTPGAVLKGTPPSLARVLRNRHLPQGSPCSPAIANLCAHRLDMRLTALAAALGARYSRYADDLTFSGGTELAQVFRRLHIQVAAIALEEGFTVNLHKTLCMSQGTRQTVTGIVVNGGTNIARTDYDTLKAILHNCAKHGVASQERDRHINFRAHLEGRVAHITGINPARGARLAVMLEKIDWNGAAQAVPA